LELYHWLHQDHRRVVVHEVAHHMVNGCPGCPVRLMRAGYETGQNEATACHHQLPIAVMAVLKETRSLLKIWSILIYCVEKERISLGLNSTKRFVAN